VEGSNKKKRKVEEKNVDANPATEDGGVVEIDVDQSK
jgi:hypothetical protein